MLVHDRPGGHDGGDRRGWPGPGGEGGQDHLGCRRAVAERGVRADVVVVPPPALDHDLRLAQAVEDLAVEQLVPELPVERLAVAVTGHADPGARVSRHPRVAVYGATIRDTGHREHVER